MWIWVWRAFLFGTWVWLEVGGSAPDLPEFIDPCADGSCGSPSR